MNDRNWKRDVLSGMVCQWSSCTIPNVSNIVRYCRTCLDKGGDCTWMSKCEKGMAGLVGVGELANGFLATMAVGNEETAGDGVVEFLA